MKELLGYRALASLCRQRAVYDPDHSWKWLGQAERWEHLASAAVDSRYAVDHAERGETGDRSEKKMAAALR